MKKDEPDRQPEPDAQSDESAYEAPKVDDVETGGEPLATMALITSS